MNNLLLCNSRNFSQDMKFRALPNQKGIGNMKIDIYNLLAIISIDYFRNYFSKDNNENERLRISQRI